MLRLGTVEGALESFNVNSSGLSVADAVGASNGGFWDWDCCSGLTSPWMNLKKIENGRATAGPKSCFSCIVASYSG